MSFLNSSTIVKTESHLAPHITKAQVLSFLHDHDRVLYLNPLVKCYTLLPDASSTAFFKSEPAENKPPATGPHDGPVPLYQITESCVGKTEAQLEGSNWRGGWASKFISDEMTYETSMQNTDDGMLSLCHAAMGVVSSTRWAVQESSGGEGLVVVTEGHVTCNKMLMPVVKRILPESYNRLARDFVKAIEKMAEEEGKGVEKGEVDAVDSLAVVETVN